MSKMTPEEYEAFKKSLAETQEKTAKMLARIDQTLVGVRDTLQQIKENNDNIDNFQKAYGDVMMQLASKLAASFANPFKRLSNKTYEHLPSSPPLSELIHNMLQHKEVLIVTGAGVSAASGIPTFRGEGGLYAKKFEWEGQQYQPEEFITANFYSKHPKAIWQWVDQIYQLALQCKPSKLHLLLDRLARTLAAKGQSITLVTQNIDDLHLRPQSHSYSYEAVHGNVKYVRCCNLHLSPYEQYRERLLAGDGAVCAQCGEPLRPHVLFFDESYGPLYGEDVKGRSFPFAILVGTSLSTGLCSSLAQRAEQILEINPHPVIEVGKVYQYSQDSVSLLEQILEKLDKTK